MGGGEQHEARHLVDDVGRHRQPRVGEHVPGQGGRVRLVLAGGRGGVPDVDGVVEPRGQADRTRIRPGLRPRPLEQVHGLEHREQVGRVVVVPMRLRPAGQQVASRRRHRIRARRRALEQPRPAPGEDDVALLGAAPGGHAQPRGGEAAHQLPSGDGHRPAGHELGASVRGHVVVVPVEGPLREPRRPRERVELLEGGVGDEVGEHGAVGGPRGRVDQDGHAPTLGSTDRGAAGRPHPGPFRALRTGTSRRWRSPRPGTGWRRRPSRGGCPPGTPPRAAGWRATR
ncbi:Uncharacterised protein [Streptococcus pneumoniae]|nr:Uncharacterised protein [Streptococcus pneumoniae]